MKVSYYPGCTAHSTSVEYGMSAHAVFDALDVELSEIDDWNCCGGASAKSLSRALGLNTTAEGIENHKAVEMLKKLGCDAGQGYLFGTPEPASMVTAALNESGASGKAGSPRQIA